MRSIFTAVLAGALALAVPLFSFLPCAQAQFQNWTQGAICNASVVYDASTNGATQLVALVTGQRVRICGYTIYAVTATNVSLVTGTGTACASNQAAVTAPYALGNGGFISEQGAYANSLVTPPSYELCLLTSAGNHVQALVRYTQF